METRREAVKDMLREYIGRRLHESPDSAYEHACSMADCIFYALGISDAEQDEPVVRQHPLILV